MKKFLTAAVAAVIASTSLGVASAAEAQSRYDRQDRREQRLDNRDRREFRQDRREFRQDVRQYQRQNRQAVRQNERAYARYQRANQRYNAGRYVAPRGYTVRQWSYGQRLPAHYRTNSYVVRDYNRYGLHQPPHGYHYVRSGNDVVLAAVAGGLITAVIAGLFN